MERAAKLLRDIAQHNEISDVEAVEDTIVYSGTTHDEFVGKLPVYLWKQLMLLTGRNR